MTPGFYESLSGQEGGLAPALRLLFLTLND
jgi:hypothetical protein